MEILRAVYDLGDGRKITGTGLSKESAVSSLMYGLGPGSNVVTVEECEFERVFQMAQRPISPEAACVFQKVEPLGADGGAVAVAELPAWEESEDRKANSFETKLEAFVEIIRRKVGDHYRENLSNLEIPEFAVSPGGVRYARIFATENGGTRVFCFVDRDNGDILMAASWKTPAKGKRGSIYDDDPEQAITVHGAKYLR